MESPKSSITKSYLAKVDTALSVLQQRGLVPYIATMTIEPGSFVGFSVSSITRPLERWETAPTYYGVSHSTWNDLLLSQSWDGSK